jgi:hypothetical protein
MGGIRIFCPFHLRPGMLRQENYSVCGPIQPRKDEAEAITENRLQPGISILFKVGTGVGTMATPSVGSGTTTLATDFFCHSRIRCHTNCRRSGKKDNHILK